MKELVKSYLDIIMLRKGPDVIPSSWLILSISIGLLIISSAGVLLLINNESDHQSWINFIGYFLGIAFYMLILTGYGYNHRILQTISAIIACGSLITIVFVLEFIFFAPFIGKNFAGLIASLIMLWSVPVEGHIISSAINSKRFIGIIIAITALFLQFLFQINMSKYLTSVA